MTKRPDRCRVANNGSEASVLSVFDLPKAVAMLDECCPPGERPAPWSNVVGHADVAPQYLAAPAVVIPGDPENGNTGVDQVGERRQNAKRCARNHVAPFEPELEQVAVDHERARPRRQMP